MDEQNNVSNWKKRAIDVIKIIFIAALCLAPFVIYIHESSYASKVFMVLVSFPVIFFAFVHFLSGKAWLSFRKKEGSIIPVATWIKLVLIAIWSVLLVIGFNSVEEMREHALAEAQRAHVNLLREYTLTSEQIHHRYPSINAKLDEVCDSRMIIRGKQDETGLHLACIPSVDTPEPRYIMLSDSRKLGCESEAIIRPIALKTLRVASGRYRCVGPNGAILNKPSIKWKG